MSVPFTDQLKARMNDQYGHMPLDELHELVYNSEEEPPEFMEFVYRYMTILDMKELLPVCGATSDSINAFYGYFKDDYFKDKEQFAKYWLEDVLSEEHIDRYYPSFMQYSFDLEKVAKYLITDDLETSPYIAIADDECIAVFANIHHPCYANKLEKL